jgi:hypothetical protein
MYVVQAEFVYIGAVIVVQLVLAEPALLDPEGQDPLFLK